MKVIKRVKKVSVDCVRHVIGCKIEADHQHDRIDHINGTRKIQTIANIAPDVNHPATRRFDATARAAECFKV